jgi:hypothetical protein
MRTGAAARRDPMVDSSNLRMALAALAVLGSVAIGGCKCSGSAPGARLAGSPVIGEPVQDDGMRRDPFERKGYTIAQGNRF